MLETWMEQQMIFYAMGLVFFTGIVSKLISQNTLRRMVRAAGNMNKSNHKLMKLVKAKFEHASMISDKVQNVGAFVKKFIYEYTVFGIRLYTWRRLEIKSIWLMGIFGAAGVLINYRRYGMGEMVFQYGAWAGVGVVLLFLVHNFTDETYHLQMAENYMIDFLENVCVHRYTRVCREKEVPEQSFIQMETEEEAPFMEAEAEEEAEEELLEEKIPQDARIRKILEEFLA